MLDDVNPEHKEGKVTKTIEEQTAKIPSAVKKNKTTRDILCNADISRLKHNENLD